MAIVPISIKAIDAIKKNPSKLEELKKPNNLRDICTTDEEYISTLSTAIFTHISHKDNKNQYAYINTLTTPDNQDPDLSYLIQVLTKNENFDFDIVSVLDLYESLLKENWTNVLKERQILNSIRSTNKTAQTNMKICQTIVKFLKQNLLTNENNYSV